MAFASHSGPIRVGTVKEGSGRNTGLVKLVQSATVAFGAMTTTPAAQALFTLPAGSKILSFSVEKLVVISGGSVSAVNLTIGKSGTADAYMTSAAIGLTLAPTLRATLDAAFVSPAADNIGTTDVPVTGTFTAVTGNPTAGSAVVTVEYVQRADSGAANPVSV